MKILAGRDDFTGEQKRKVLGANAARLFRL